MAVHTQSRRTFLGELRRGDEAAPEFVWLDSGPREAKNYLEDFAGEVDHSLLVERLMTDYPDGWALSLSGKSLKTILAGEDHNDDE